MSLNRIQQHQLQNHVDEAIWLYDGLVKQLKARLSVPDDVQVVAAQLASGIMAGRTTAIVTDRNTDD